MIRNVFQIFWLMDCFREERLDRLCCLLFNDQIHGLRIDLLAILRRSLEPFNRVFPVR